MIIPRVVIAVKTCVVLFFKIFMVFPVVFNSGCSYENVHVYSSINIEFEQESSTELFKAVQAFSDKHQLVIQDESKKFPSGLSSILYELRNKDGLRLFKVSDLMDKKRFVISVYEVNEQEVGVLFESMFVFLKENFPNAIVEVKK
ncbi:hypothetical protein [Pseudoalteromonas rubra]|uniref:hypothetical protein n=1 Tax=Pseudoalteromonas rubra TaxID=43658 RepID=UPI000F77F3D1|nr:hypothetical protein [Pseudoalteromonas rubra]